MQALSWLTWVSKTCGAKSLPDLSRRSILSVNDPVYEEEQFSRLSQLKRFPDERHFLKVGKYIEQNYDVNPNTMYHLGPNGIPLWGALAPDIVYKNENFPLSLVCHKWNWSFDWPNEVHEEYKRRIRELKGSVKNSNDNAVNILDVPKDQFKNLVHDPHSIALDLGIGKMPELTDWHYLTKSIILYHVSVERIESYLEYERYAQSVFDGSCIANDFDELGELNDEDTEDPHLLALDMATPFISTCEVADKNTAKQYIFRYLDKLAFDISSIGLKKEHFVKFLELYFDPLKYSLEFDKKDICVFAKLN